jgi:tetratricopeptide (TPR) repeat protein
LGAPIPHEGDLYALAEIKGQIVLVVLNSDNGQLKWQQQLVQVEGTNISMDVRRRVAGATPSIAGNVLVCPTGNGAVIAIDVTTRSLLWGYQYTDVVNVAISPYSTTNTHQIGNRWVDYAPTIVDGRVLLTPAESGKLYCLDLVTGKPAWTEKPRENHLFTACVHKGVAVMATMDGLVGMRLADGGKAWVLKLGRTPTGRGFQNGKLYYYPAGKTLFVIDIEEGKIIKEVKTQQPLGNLICYGDKVISQSPTEVVAYYQSEPLRERIPLRLKENPEDVEALALLGQLHLNDGDRRAAIETFRKAHKLSPEDATTQKLLFTTLLESLQSDFDHAAPLMAELQKLIRHPEQKVAYLRLLAVGYQKTGQTVKAMKSYVELTELEQSRQLNIDPTKIPLEHIAENLMVRGDRWLRQRLVELLASTPAADKAEITKLVNDQWKKVNDQGSIRATRQFVAYFGTHPVGDDARLNLAVKLAENDSHLEAELILDDLANANDKTTAARASAQLSKLLTQLNRFDAAVRYLQKLETEYADVVCMDGKTGKEIAEIAKQRDDMKANFNRPYNWPSGIVEHSDTGDQLPRSPSYYRRYAVSLRESLGSLPAGTKITLDQQRQNLIFHNSLGETMHQISIRRPDNRSVYTGNYHLTHAKARGHLVVAFFGYQLIAIDLLKAAKNVNEAVIWRADLLPAGTSNSSISRRIMQKSLSSPWGLPIYYPTDQHSNRVGEVGPITPWGICYQKQNNLNCVSPTTGLTVWTRHHVPAGSMLLGDEKHLVVVPPNSDDILIMSHIDGTITRKMKRDRTYQWWHGWSRFSLTWKTSNGKQILRSTDLVTGEAVWEKEFAPNSKGYIVDNKEVAVMESDGKFTVMALDSDEPKIETTVEPEPSLQSIFVTRSADQYFLLANRPRQPNTEDVIQPVPPGYNPAWVNAKVYAFDETGKSQWELPAEINDFGFPLDQPDDSPFLLFMRHRTPRTGNNRKPRTSVACINKKDGSLAFFDDSIDTSTHMYSVIARPEKNEAVLMLPGKSFTLKFTDEAGPPEPRAFVGQITPSQTAKIQSTSRPIPRVVAP